MTAATTARNPLKNMSVDITTNSFA